MLRIGVLDEQTRSALQRRAGTAGSRVHVGVACGDADRDACWHLVIAGSGRPDGGADIHLDETEDLEALWRDRLATYASNLAAGRRAPRRLHVELHPPDPTWAARAYRIGARLRAALGPLARRVDHVGSTSVPGLPAKDILDLQVLVDTLADTAAAGRAHDAGLVAVQGGDFYAIDRHDRRHPERILVDADPGRPVNVHLHPASSPVWQEVLVFRDWLRGNPSARDEYAAFKRTLAARPGTDVIDYSRAKRDWVNDAVSRARRWAGATD